MDYCGINDIAALLRGNSYPGRGIVIGKTADGKHAVTAYFIMGRSANSRNRVFAVRDGALYTEPYDASKVEDPRLIIYPALRRCGNRLIVTNGDHTDTVYEGLLAGRGFAEALRARTYEPDAPNYTPRISGLLTFADGDFSYELSILRRADGQDGACSRFTFSYEPQNGVGHFIHTYAGDGAPLPSFRGEPVPVAVPDGIDRFTDSLWDALDHENRISLYVCYTELEICGEDFRLLNKNK